MRFNKVKLISLNNNLLFNPKEEKGIDPKTYTSPYSIDILSEFAGRLCYKSGYQNQKNRPTREYFRNIIESKHYSVFGHSMFTFKVLDTEKVLDYMASRKRVYIRKYKNNYYVVLSLRHLVEDLNNNQIHPLTKDLILFFFDKTLILELFENIQKPKKFSVISPSKDFTIDIYSFLIYTSRRTSLELIRHNTEYAVSQESTRYVDKSDFELVNQPMFRRLKIEEPFLLKMLTLFSRFLYSYYSKTIPFSSTLEKKYIRGLLSGYLLQDIDTKLVFTVTDFQLKSIFEQRLTRYADPNIYDLVLKMKEEVLNEL